MWPTDASWPIVGRDGSENACTSTLIAGRSVLIAGGAGIGKTFLARTVADRLEATSEVTVLRLVASAASELPPLVPATVEASVLVVDDIQLLDLDNAAKLHRWVVDDGGRILATYRSHDGHRLSPSLDSLWRDDLLVRIDLLELTRTDVDELLDAVLGGPIEATTRRRLWDLTLGSPLYVRELLHAALRSGALTESHGFWTLDDTIVSPALDELIEHRVNALSPAALHVVELVALGAPIGLAPLSSSIGLDAIDDAETSGIIDVVRDDRRVDVHIGHPLYADVVCRHMGGARLAERTRELIEMVETTPMRRRTDIVRAATWQLRSGGTVVSDDMVLAARRALYDRNEALALELARSTGDQHRIDAAIVESEALSNVGRHEQAETLLREVGGTTSEMHAALIANQRAIALFWGLGAVGDAIDVLERAEDSLPEGAWRRELTAERAVLTAMSGDANRAIELAAPLLADPAVRVGVTAAIAASVSMSLGHSAVDAIQLSRDAQRRSAELSDQPMISDPAIHVVAEAMALSEAGDLAAAAELAEAGLAVSLAQGLREGQAWFSLILGRIQVTRGLFEPAMRAFVEAAGAFTHQHSDGPRRWALAGQILASCARGDDNERERAWKELAAIPEHPARIMETEVQRAVAWRQRSRGDRIGAKDTLLHAASDAAGRGFDGLAAAALHDLVRLDLVDDDFTHSLWENVRPTQGRLGVARRRLADAVIAVDGGGAEEAATQFAAAGAPLLAVESAYVAVGLFETRGDQRSAAAAQRRYRELADQVDDDWLLTLDRSVARVELTSREREIAELALAGHRNRAISEELSISVRTVENHLQRIYIKLGIRARDELDSALV